MVVLLRFVPVAIRCASVRNIAMTRNMKKTMSLITDELLQRGWVRKGDFIVRFSDPRIGWDPEDGRLVIGWHEYPEKVETLEKLEEVLHGL